MPTGELAYLFRHALVRDAAYMLQPPSARAALHAHAIPAMEAAMGGRPPQPELDAWGVPVRSDHPLYALATDLADHARLAQESGGGDSGLHAARLHYLRLAGLHAERHFRPLEALEARRQLSEICEPAAAPEVLRRAGEAAQLAELREETYELLGRAIEAALELGDLKNASLAITLRATRHRHDGQNTEARADYERGLAIRRELGDRGGQCSSLTNLGSFLYETGNTPEAEKAFNEALEIALETGNERAEAAALGGLANLLIDRGEGASAEELLKRSLDLHRRVGNRRFVAVSLAGLGNLYLFASRYAEAEATYRDAIDIYRETGNRRFEGVTLGNLAMVYESTERLEDAERCALEALAIHRELENRRGIGVATGALAGLAAARGDTDAAERGYTEALRLHREVGNRHFEAYVLCEHGRLLLNMGRTEEARREWLLGEAMLVELGDENTRTDVRRKMHEDCARLGLEPFDTTHAE